MIDYDYTWTDWTNKLRKESFKYEQSNNIQDFLINEFIHKPRSQFHLLFLVRVIRICDYVNLIHINRKFIKLIHKSDLTNKKLNLYDQGIKIKLE